MRYILLKSSSYSHQFTVNHETHELLYKAKGLTMKNKFLIISLFLLISGFWSMQPAHAQLLSENFDSYVSGSQVHGQGGWKGWNNVPAAGALATNTNSLTPPNSVDIVGASDLVHEFSGANMDIVEVIAWQYIPSDFTGQTYFILLNTYTDVGATNWSTQLMFESTSNTISEAYNLESTLPLIIDQWVQIRVVINHPANTQDIYYNGQLLVSKSWTEGASGGGAQNLAAIDLYANASTSVYYDDISVTISCEMDVRGGSVSTSIPNGNPTPSTTDGTDFGSALVGNNTTQTYTIENTGTATLGIGTITIGGTNADDFTLTASPSATVATGGGTTTFTVQFAPSATGLRTATISIENTDTDEDPYNFSIQGGFDEAASIPTINEWGMIIFSLLLGSVAIWYMRKKGHGGCMA